MLLVNSEVATYIICPSLRAKYIQLYRESCLTDWQIQNWEIKGWNFNSPESFSLGLCQFLQLYEKFSSHEKRVVKIVLILM